MDFVIYGDSKAVQKAFERLAISERLIRVAWGIYCYPQIDKVLGVGVLYPTFEEIAVAIAKREKARIVPIKIISYISYYLNLFYQIVGYFFVSLPEHLNFLSKRAIQY